MFFAYEYYKYLSIRTILNTVLSNILISTVLYENLIRLKQIIMVGQLHCSISLQQLISSHIPPLSIFFINLAFLLIFVIVLLTTLHLRSCSMIHHVTPLFTSLFFIRFFAHFFVLCIPYQCNKVSYVMFSPLFLFLASQS